jgi:hypothetical protein
VQNAPPRVGPIFFKKIPQFSVGAQKGQRRFDSSCLCIFAPLAFARDFLAPLPRCAREHIELDRAVAWAKQKLKENAKSYSRYCVSVDNPASGQNRVDVALRYQREICRSRRYQFVHAVKVCAHCAPQLAVNRLDTEHGCPRGQSQSRLETVSLGNPLEHPKGDLWIRHPYVPAVLEKRPSREVRKRWTRGSVRHSEKQRKGTPSASEPVTRPHSIGGWSTVSGTRQGRMTHARIVKNNRVAP